jgi:hypothetical protein
VVIKRPAAGEAARLLAALRTGAGGQSEAAAARLVVLGARAAPHVLEALASEVDEVQASRLVSLLGQLPTSRGTLAALDASLQDRRPAVARAALDAWGTLLSAPDAAVAAQALDRLTALALDESQDVALRARAAKVLATSFPGHELRPLLDRLAADRTPEIRAAVTGAQEEWTDLAPDADPETVRRFVGENGDTAPLPDLHRLVVLARERSAADPAQGAQWAAVRAAVHHALAQRGSTVALYDLREMLLRSPTPPPLGALSALALVGDASCVDALADAYDRLDDSWTREQLVRVFRAIASRTKMSRRHASMKRLVAVDHPILAALPAKKTSK